jgi:hypothetical protein
VEVASVGYKTQAHQHGDWQHVGRHVDVHSPASTRSGSTRGHLHERLVKVMVNSRSPSLANGQGHGQLKVTFTRDWSRSGSTQGHLHERLVKVRVNSRSPSQATGPIFNYWFVQLTGEYLYYRPIKFLSSELKKYPGLLDKPRIFT